MSIGKIDATLPSSTLYLSAIEVKLANDSGKTIRSIKLYKNDELLRDLEKTIHAGQLHQEDFSQPPTLCPGDNIRVLAICSAPWSKPKDVNIDVNLGDNECVRNEENMKSYRKKIRKIEVVISASCQQSSSASFTTQIQACPRFRLLVIGNSGVGKSTLIHKVFGVEGVKPSQNRRGEAEIEREFTSTTNERFVVHDSLGFEAGDERHMEIVKQFITQRKAMPLIRDQLHAIWLCLDVPFAGGRLLETGVENLLRRRTEILGDIPLVVVLTKVDLLDGQLELELPKNVALESYRSRHMREFCIEPLHHVAGSDVTHVAVSTEEGYSDSLLGLLEATNNNMTRYHVDGSPSIVASIAQRISIQKKIELSIGIGKSRYRTLVKDAIFHGEKCTQHLRAIYKDAITIWNFNDPNKFLMNDDFIGALCDVKLEGADSTTQSPTPGSFSEQLNKFLGSQDPMLLVPRKVAGVALAVPLQMNQGYKEVKKDVKTFMAYVIDLNCIMQIIFLLISGDPVAPEIVNVAIRAYEEPKITVRSSIRKVDPKIGLFPGGRDKALDKIEELIWLHSIADHDIQKIRENRDRSRVEASS